MTSMSHLDDLSLGNPTRYAPTFYSGPQLLARRHLISTAPSLKKCSHLFLSLITENPTSLPGIVACAINLFHFSKTSAFWCLGLWPHINPLQDKTTLNYQGNKCNLTDLPSSYWTPSTKNPWWMNSGLMFSVLPQQEKTEQPLRQLLFKRTITVESHMACQSYYRPSVLLSFLSKVITNLYSTTGTLYKFSSKRLLGGGEVEIFR